MVSGDVIDSVDGITEKSSSALRTIGEVSEFLDIPQHVLRFWEKRFSQIKPVKRRGRRYYCPEDIALLGRIKSLLYTEGLTIKGAKKLLSQPSERPQPDLFKAPENTQNAEADLSTQSGLRPALSGEEKEALQNVLKRLVKARETLDSVLA